MARILDAAFRMFCAVAMVLAPMMPMPAGANGDHPSLLRVSAADGYPAVRRVELGLNKSMVVELPTAVRDVMVSNPEKIDAVMQTSRRAYVIGKQLGEANVFFTDDQGHQVLTLEISVQRDLSALQSLLARLIPDSSIQVEAYGGNVLLTGKVRTPMDANRASQIANSVLTYDPDQPQITSSSSDSGTAGGSSSPSNSQSNGTDARKVINMITVEGEEQVLLKVTIAEMQRNVAKQLGVNLDALVNSGSFQFAALSRLPFPVNQGPIAPARVTAGWASGGDSVQAMIQAMEQNGLVHTLAEPNLTAISGETANFLAGGEFPVPISGQNGQITVEFKKFGVGLAFTPVVMAEGRISLKISTEVSELTNEGAVSVPLNESGDTVSIPALNVRRAETTVELPSGGSLAMAGLLSDQSRQTMAGYPGLKNLPILGTLFRSRDFQKSETELVILVTPYIARSVPRGELTQPDQGFAWASDVNADLLGHMNRVYGRDPERAPAGNFDGDVGFIVE